MRQLGYYVVMLFQTLVAFLLPLTVSSTPQPDALIAQVEAYYANQDSVQAAVQHTYVDSTQIPTTPEQGHLWATADGRMRLSYQHPERKDFVFDGTTAYMYEPDSAQVTIVDNFAQSRARLALGVLWGQGPIRKHFEVRACKRLCDTIKPAAGNHLLELWPKKPIPSVRLIGIVIAEASGQVQQAIVVDPLDQRAEYTLSDVKVGEKLGDDVFRFVVPRGVSVLHASSDIAP